MNEREFAERLEQATPEVPNVFHQAMLGAFAQISEQEQQERHPSRPRRSLKSRTAAVILIAALLTATVAVAAVATLMPRAMSIFWGKDVAMQENFLEQVRYDVLEKTVGSCRIRIEEAAYDGASLYVTYSVRNADVERMLGISEPRHPEALRSLTVEDYEEIATWDATNWHDGLWINGQECDMVGTAIEMYGGDESGEYVVSSMYRMDMLGLDLHGQARIALPVGRNQKWHGDEYTPLPRDEEGNAIEPAEGCIVFYVDTDAPDAERIENGPVSVWPDGTEIWVSRAIFTPVKLYLTLNFNIPDALVEAYIEEQGSDGWYMDEEMLFHYSALDIASGWAYDLILTDENGVPVPMDLSRGDHDDGLGDHVSYKTFPYVETYPTPLYIAPKVDGKPDMTRKVLVRE